jgi:hypothetical protein
MRHLLAIALLTAIPVSGQAQHFSPARQPARPGFPRSQHSRNFSGGYYPAAYFAPLDWDSMYPPDYSVPAQPYVIVLQPPAAPAVSEPPPPPAHALLIELQGDRYVEINDEDPQPRAATRSQSQPPASWRQDAVLIFRDGHREQVSGYAITGGFLYATANYYTEGSWNRKIELSSLNLPDTVSANQSRGINFQLPSASNEVTVGP